MRTRTTFFASLLSLCLLASPAFAQKGYPKLSPFESLRPKEGKMEVKVKGTWYELKAIEGKTFDEIMTFCKEKYHHIAHKRFSEDLVQVLNEMGLEPDDKVQLDLIALDSRQSVQLRDVEMTKENRKAVWRENVEGEGGRGPILDLIRSGDLKANPKADVHSVVRSLNAAQVASDLAQLRRKIEEEYSYRDRVPEDWQQRLKALHIDEGTNIPLSTFHIKLREFIASFGDGHSRARGVHGVISGWYPFALVKVKEGYAAFGAGGALYNPDFPFLMEIEDQSPEHIAPQLGLVTQGSPSLRLIDSERFMAAASFIDKRNRKPESEVHFKNAAGEIEGRSKKTDVDWVHAPVMKRRPLPTRHAYLKDDDLGYIRIPSMDSDAKFLTEIEEKLDEYREAKGLIIDLRGNGGGSRAALLLMLPRFLQKGERRVANWAIYRLPKEAKNDPENGHLSDRNLWPIESSHWTDDERSFLKEQLRSFKPEWQPKDLAAFSSLHAMLMTGTGENAHQPAVVLIDRYCFSATDIFAGAFADLPQVTVIGETTAGGSGRAQGFQLACSGIEVKLSTMVSYRPDGQLYDGKGIAPDIEVIATLEDWLGKTDSEMEAALGLCRRR